MLNRSHIAVLAMLTACTIPAGSFTKAAEDAGGADGKAVIAVDARVCFGTNPVTICLEDAPIAPLTISSATVLNTENSPMCMRVKSGGPPYCVLAGTTITIGAPLRATGLQPLVLVATDSISLTAYGSIDVGSHRGASPEIGAGADPGNCPAGTNPDQGDGGGGAGGSFAGRGGNGGTGNAVPGMGGVSGAATTQITELRGGCRGQDATGPSKGIGGHGGGVVHLIAGSTINVIGIINAAGEGGGGGGGCSGTVANGGGGGGAGGMIGFDAPIVTGSNLILASGGGGGSGCISIATPTMGYPGADPTTVAAASGGVSTYNTGAGIGESGDGGYGSSAVVAGAGMNGMASQLGGGGGGGGGGGTGMVKAPLTAALGTKVSPPAMP
jgi:hypothetical protein